MRPPFPEYVQFFPTLKCNRRCSFCFNRGITQTEEISIRDFGRLAGILSAGGIAEIDLLGGEPTLHPGIIRLLEITREHRLRANLSTNGSNVPLLESISKTFGADFLKTGISLNEATVSHELHEYIIRHRPLLKSLCRKGKTLPAPALTYLGTPGIHYYLLYLDTISRNDLPDSLPFPDFYRQLQILRSRHENIEGVFCSGFIPDRKQYPLLRRARCPAGTTKLSILPDGSVYPCYLFFRRRDFRLGNLFEDDFSVIWENPLLDYFRAFTKNNCVDARCELQDECHGGCPAVSLLITGDLNAPDPRCSAVGRQVVM